MQETHHIAAPGDRAGARPVATCAGLFRTTRTDVRAVRSMPELDRTA